MIDLTPLSPLPTQQEMFDRAVRGLRSQGFKRAVTEKRSEDGELLWSRCVYRQVADDGTVKRCAWGWVDQTLDAEVGDVTELRRAGIGLAARLDVPLSWASELQSMHDGAQGDEEGQMEEMLRGFGRKHELVWPED